MGPDPAHGDGAAAPPSPRRKRMREDSGPALSGPEFRISATKWQYRGTKTAPLAGAAEGQERPKAPRPAPAPEPSAPAEPGLASSTAGPRPADAAAEAGQTDATAAPELADAAAEPEPTGVTSLLGPADAVAERVPADAAAEAETQPSPERSVADELDVSAALLGAMRACTLDVKAAMRRGDGVGVDCIAPYMFYLYSQYNFDQGDIGRLFISGFGSSMLFDTIGRPLANKQFKESNMQGAEEGVHHLHHELHHQALAPRA
ncbi:uncharacterized protein LOC133927701 [Phragmites australis]|uniref:uncharacterized protein LOC133927701 n=1 Tax=Phragmites australis TaxID=29695 RepID=UPI002D77C86D|nr:uncharacterized protein LOC133927701 [Phragmites australis]